MSKGRRLTKPLGICISLIALWTSGSGSAGPIRTERPPCLGYHAMVYDSASGKLVLFGGQTGDPFEHPELCLCSDTWVYDFARKEWERLNPSVHPPAMSAHAMAYDVESGKTILHGAVQVTKGKEPRLLRETWVFDYPARTWKKMSDGPPERYGHRMVYDSESGVVILFGGACVDRSQKINNKKLGDTWVYELKKDAWTETKPGPAPSPRHYHGMAYDSRADRVIVWGGAKEGAADAASVWVYDYESNTWTERRPKTGPNPLYYHAMDYDAQSDKVIVFGGLTGGSSETWAYDFESNAWTRRNPSRNPGRLSRMPVVFVAGWDRLVLFGGQLDERPFTYSDETWSYDFESDSWTNETIRRGEYLGQKKPGAVPEVFAPGFVSSGLYEHGAPALSPDGRELYWSVFWEKEFHQKIFFVREDGGRWSAPQKASFVDDRYLDGNPVFSPDGRTIFFTTNRPLEGNSGARGYSLWIWFVEKTAEGWSTPRPLPATFSEVGLASAPSFAPEGTLLFVPWKGRGVTAFDIYSARWLGGQYRDPERLPDSINSGDIDEYPFVPADGGYLLFSSTRAGGLGKEDIYIAFRRKDGLWGEAANLGPRVNSTSSERFPYVSPDGRFLFFGSDRNGNFDTYWVEARIIKDLRPE